MLQTRLHPSTLAKFSLAVAFFCFALGANEASAQTAQPHPGGGFNPLNWKMPKFQAPKMPSFGSLLPGQSDKQRLTKKKDNLLTDVGATARKSWAKTKEVLNPAKLNPANLFKPASPSPPTSKKEPGFFSSLFSTPEPPDRIGDVNEFLRQDNPMTINR